jgi:K(+)-stimulated pyrophosphate-energized sodium pump
MNPVIKFTTLFGLLAVELGVYLSAGGSSTLSRGLAVAFFAAALLFVWRSFYGMRIEAEPQSAGAGRPVAVKA